MLFSITIGSNISTSPVLLSSLLASSNSLYLTVDICGIKSDFICARIFSLKAGLICTSFLSSLSISSPVQSAVNPHSRVAATLGANDLPKLVAPKRHISGCTSLIIFTTFFAYVKTSGMLNISSSFT